MNSLAKYLSVGFLAGAMYLSRESMEKTQGSDLEIKVNAPSVKVLTGRDLSPQIKTEILENITESKYIPQEENIEISETGINLIKTAEGFSSIPLIDINQMSIGYGHKIGNDENYKSITRKTADELLEKDLEWVKDAISRNVKVDLNQNQYDAITSFMYNLGETKFRKSDLLEELNNNNYSIAAEEFKRWIWADGDKQKGLVKRRQAEYELFLTPEK